MPPTHTDREYQDELDELKSRVQAMRALVESMAASSLRALSERDSSLARNTIDSDNVVDRLEIEIDDRCLELLARRQPVANDLRLIMSTLKMVTDLERIADLSVDVCEGVIGLGGDSTALVDRVLRIAEAALAMVRDAFRACVAIDVELARDVMRRQEFVDGLYTQLLPESVTYITSHPTSTADVTRLQSFGKYFERMAAHATNIAEMVVFIAHGEDVRHAQARGTV